MSVLLAAVMLSVGVTTALGAYGPMVPVSPAGQNASQPHIAIAPDGATTVAWWGLGSTYFAAAAARASGATDFGTATTLSDTADEATDTQVAVGPDGSATVVWSRLDYSVYEYVIQAATRPAGSSTFGPAINLPTGTTITTGPQVAVGPDGATTVVWRAYDGSGYIVEGATRPAGSSTFESLPLLADSGSDPGGTVRMAIGPDGTTTVVWQRSSGGKKVVFVTTRAAGSSTFGTPVPLSDVATDADQPQIAVGRDGATTVVFWQSNGTHKIVQAITRPAGASTFGDPMPLSAAGAHATDPQVAVGPDGSATAVWRRSDGGNIVIQAATRAAGTSSFSSPVSLSATGRDAYDPQVAVGPDGAVTVVWTRFNGSNYIVQTATRAAGSADFGAMVELSAPGGNAGGPQVGVGPDGAATVVWSRFDGTSNAVQSATSAPTLARLTVTVEGSGSVTSAPAGISCGTACSATFGVGSSVTLTASPSAGSAFSGWSGACAGNATTCTVPMASATAVTATFGPPSASTGTVASTVKVSSPLVARAAVRSRVTVDGAGTVTQRGVVVGRRGVACTGSAAATAAETVTVTCVLRPAVRLARRTRALRMRLVTTFTPFFGPAVTASRVVILPRTGRAAPVTG